MKKKSSLTPLAPLATINQLRGKVTMLFITHALPKGLQVDEVVRIGGGTLAPVPTSQDKDGV